MKNIIVIDIGGTNIRVGAMNHKKELLEVTTEKLPKIKDELSLIEITSKKISELRKRVKNLSAISISVAGPLRNKRKSFFFSAHNILVNLAQPLEKKFSLPINLLNDTEAAVVAIKEKEYPQIENITFITISTGIGVGSIINGQLISGFSGSAGEFGMIDINARFLEGTPRTWEASCAGKRDDKVGIISTYRLWAKYHNKKINNTYINPKDIFDAHRNNSDDVKGFLDEIGKINAKGIENIILAYDPEVIVFGGSIAQNNYDIIIKGINRNIDTNKISFFPQFTKSKVGDLISLYGAGYNQLNK